MYKNVLVVYFLTSLATCIGCVNDFVKVVSCLNKELQLQKLMIRNKTWLLSISIVDTT